MRLLHCVRNDETVVNNEIAFTAFAMTNVPIVLRSFRHWEERSNPKTVVNEIASLRSQ